jgi:hypothetical protein
LARDQYPIITEAASAHARERPALVSAVDDPGSAGAATAALEITFTSYLLGNSSFGSFVAALLCPPRET